METRLPQKEKAALASSFPLYQTRRLRARDVDRRRALLTLLNFEGDDVTLAKLIKSDAVEIFGVEEEILRLAFAGDESESTVRQSLDGSFHMFSFVLLLL